MDIYQAEKEPSEVEELEKIFSIKTRLIVGPDLDKIIRDEFIKLVAIINGFEITLANIPRDSMKAILRSVDATLISARVVSMIQDLLYNVKDKNVKKRLLKEYIIALREYYSDLVKDSVINKMFRGLEGFERKAEIGEGIKQPEKEEGGEEI